MKKTCSSKGQGTREGGDSGRGRGRGSGIVSGKANYISSSFFLLFLAYVR